MSRCRAFRSRLHLPEDLTRDILLRLPAKSVAMFRCISTTWLSISTDPSFILAHARRAPKFFLVYSVRRNEYIKLPSFSLSTGGIGKRRLVQNSDEAMSSCDGLVCFRERAQFNVPMSYYLQNPLSGLRIHLSNPLSISIPKNSVYELYCHRRTGEYRLLILPQHRQPNDYPKAAVLNLGRANSLREIKSGVPFVSRFNRQSSVLVNDCLYWTCRQRSPFPKYIAILVYDTLQESFSLMQIPSNCKKYSPSFENYGLVEMEGELGYWTVELYKSGSVLLEVWTAVNTDEKWRNTHSLCLAGDAISDISSIGSPRCSFTGFGEGELLCLFNDKAPYLLHWNLKSGNFYIEKLPITDNVIAIFPPARVYRETLVNMTSTPPTMP